MQICGRIFGTIQKIFISILLAISIFLLISLHVIGIIYVLFVGQSLQFDYDNGNEHNLLTTTNNPPFLRHVISLAMLIPIVDSVSGGRLLYILYEKLL